MSSFPPAIRTPPSTEALSALRWQVRRACLSLDRPLVMGIVNLTPDSFSDGGQFEAPEAALRHCEQLVAQGADILDLGAESTRPGAEPVSEAEELARLMPVLPHALKLGVPVSIDTRRTAVMRAVLDAGADIINDVQALADEGALELLAAHPAVGVCLMHMVGEPRTMQQVVPDYGDIVAVVGRFLAERCAAAQAAGIHAERISLDPGIGFGKTVDDNLTLLRRQSELQALGRPLLVGWSRKSTLGHVTGRSASERVAASLAAAVLALQGGARILRVHDVAATVDAVKVWSAVQGSSPPASPNN
jgi:dihydropteroate synthase